MDGPEAGLKVPTIVPLVRLHPLRLQHQRRSQAHTFVPPTHIHPVESVTIKAVGSLELIKHNQSLKIGTINHKNQRSIDSWLGDLTVLTISSVSS